MRAPTDMAAAPDHATVEALTRVVAQAAQLILAQGPTGARLKSDGSPVTSADHASEALMLRALGELLPGVPTVSEEQAETTRSAPGSRTFILLDPLDGTREFLAGRNEYTVNLSFVVDGLPVLGIVAAPALALLWRGVPGLGAERLALRGAVLGEPVAVRTRAWPSQHPRALVSRSHLDAETVALLGRCPGIEREPCGSSLKLCRLAEGGADLYPRLAPTSDWDIAAGHALLAAAGGLVVRPDGSALTYGGAEAGFSVPAFLALGDPGALPRVLPPRV